MRIGFVTQWFPPEAGTHLAESIATGLAGRGHHVDVLTGFPNYPTGRLAPGYKMRPYLRENHSERVTVHRAPLYPSHDSSAVRRMMNYGSFAASSAAVGRFKMPTPDVWLTYSSPATAALAAVVDKTFTSRPNCLVIQDLWPDSVTDSGMMPARARSVVRPVLDRFCSLAYRRADAIGVISPSMREILVSRGVPDGKILDTPNWSSDDLLRPHQASTPEARERLGLPSGRLFMYVGNLGHLQALEGIVEAFGMFPEAHLALIGDGVRRTPIEELVAQKSITNVHVLGPRPVAEVGDYIAASDVQIVSLQDTPLLRATMPSKMQFSLAAARPVLAHAGGDVAAIVRSENVGAVARPGVPNDLRAAIRLLSSADSAELLAMGRRARAVYEARFTQEAGLDRLEQMLHHATRLTPPAQDLTLHVQRTSS
ncbi:glycosyltransferase family 4 protein [Allobranchiibius sp. CTAmp26]|uniref:glycosyltransferase family 4 protein n=1 Tax=Allobranchiibius sp. CTAmp26 TaxID=2815214 RepID=UPI001AA1BE59|nr:glycosyltransferase family 4 protein [Allobranchiibius sp. CTAmp26]MBO1755771.1 glycosyltransferase family 4 protein [Allobranchiibius sp. CTAmp26]